MTYTAGMSRIPRSPSESSLAERGVRALRILAAGIAATGALAGCAGDSGGDAPADAIDPERLETLRALPYAVSRPVGGE